MNFEEEKALARRIQADLHGASITSTLPVFGAKSGFDVAKAYAPIISPPVKQPARIKHQDIKLFPDEGPKAIPDAQRMINYLDALQDELLSLGAKARAKLEQFTEPQPEQKSAIDSTVDTRLCRSDYFRILESRIESMQYSLKYLSDLIDSVSAKSDTGDLT